MAALCEEMLRMSLQKISTPDFGTGHLGGDRQDGHAAAVANVQAVDQMQIFPGRSSRRRRPITRSDALPLPRRMRPLLRLSDEATEDGSSRESNP